MSVSMARLESITAREKTQPITPVAGVATRSEEHPSLFYVAMTIDWAGDEVDGVWGTSSLDPGTTEVWSVDGAAGFLATWPDSHPDKHVMLLDPAAGQARECLRTSEDETEPA